MSFESTIAQQAQAELEYEIDSEAVFLIKRAADRIAETKHYRDGGQAVNFVTKWIDEELDTISTSMKAEGFAKKIAEAKMKVYRATGRFMPTWMLVNPEMMPILTFVPGFKANNANIANGPYIAGSIDGMKVIVSPALMPEMMAKEKIVSGVKKGVCYLGVLGSDGKTATGVYAPYMPIVPTQLLGFADGSMSQGFSSMYDMKILNDRLLGRIDVFQGNDAAKIGIFDTSETWF